MSNTVRLTVRMTTAQRDALVELGDPSRVVRSLISEVLGVGPVDLPRGLAAVEPSEVSRLQSERALARWKEKNGDAKS